MVLGDAVVAEKLVKRFVTKKRTGLLRSYSEVVEALRGVSLNVGAGEVVGLLGPNGAGKTTTIKILSTLLLPDSGYASIYGYDVVREASEVRKLIGIMLTVEKGFYGRLTGRENLVYFGSLYGMERRELERRVDHLLDLVGLKELGGADRLYEEYSLGMKARLALARALLKDPPVLLLDEPTLGLDPPSARKIRSLVREMASKEGKSVLYTSHNMFEVELVCDRVILINKGVIVAEGTPERLKSMLPDVRAIEVYSKQPPGSLAEEVAKLGLEVREQNQVQEGLYVLKILARRPDEVVGDIMKIAVSRGIDIVRMKVEEPTLEDVFIYFTERGVRDREVH
ncbi:MAG: ABC transporter ATP-binding protein [Sulfolobales archaeon]|nr:ABC transporter ATP-binding protein [Sulfolobales archaeon]MCX8208266.1 ABC transporter ATP-binding protein [Sulfolobales archaeon]MDW8010899.1 ABC transporter ATP-binding protein [Sulfolobales archaeon]